MASQKLLEMRKKMFNRPPAPATDPEALAADREEISERREDAAARLAAKNKPPARKAAPRGPESSMVKPAALKIQADADFLRGIRERAAAEVAAQASGNCVSCGAWVDFAPIEKTPTGLRAQCPRCRAIFIPTDTGIQGKLAALLEKRNQADKSAGFCRKVFGPPTCAATASCPVCGGASCAEFPAAFRGGQRGQCRRCGAIFFLRKPEKGQLAAMASGKPLPKN